MGGAQVVNVLSGIIKGKILAVYLGAAGLGVFNIYTSSISLLSTIAGMGLSFSAVRDISKANDSKDLVLLSTTVKIFIRWTVISCILGGIIVLLGARKLSLLTFNTLDHTNHYLWLSIVLFITPVQTGLLAILQGTRRLKDIAASSVLVSVINILLIIPIYYYWGDRGIVPVIILTAVLPMVVRLYYVKNISFEKTKVGVADSISKGHNMVKLGLLFMLISFMASGVTFLTNIYIKNFGSISDLGLYRGGMALTNQSVGLIFTAISVDYYPRLSAISKDKLKVNRLANEQTEIILLISAPIIISLIVFAPLIVRLLLTPQFNEISTFIRVIAFAVFIRAVAFSMDLISYAKGDKLLSFNMALFGNISLLAWVIIGYKISGINGIAVGQIGHYLLTLIFVHTVLKIKYSFCYAKETIIIAINSACLVLMTIIATLFLPIKLGVGIGVGILFVSSYYSYYSLNILIDLKAHLIRLLKMIYSLKSI